ncbi:MAG: hypothetical protein WBZ36_23690 [Candidatus Nitrosopolaris sp.]
MTKTEVDTMAVKETNLLCVQVGRLHTLDCSNDTRLHLKSPGILKEAGTIFQLGS